MGKIIALANQKGGVGKNHDIDESGRLFSDIGKKGLVLSMRILRPMRLPVWE